MKILMIGNHLGVQSGVQRYVQNLLLHMDLTKYQVDLFIGQCPPDQVSSAPALEAALAWMPYAVLVSVGNGAADMLAVDATGLSPAFRALAVCVPLCAVLAGAGTLATSRRDVS